MMRIQIVQFDIKRNKADENLQYLDTHLQKGADLIVLPEMFNCGFSAEAVKCANIEGHKALDWMICKSRELNVTLCGSIAFAENNRVYNRMYVVEPSGKIYSYDKRHLFSMGGVESSEIYTAGTKRVVVQIGEMRCLLQICYDLRFPVFARNRNDYDAIIYVANWPASRIENWLTLLKARAIENQCYVIGANRVGTDEGIYYSGKSIIYGPYGATIAEATADRQMSIEGEISMEPLEHFRAKFTVLRDADNFNLI